MRQAGGLPLDGGGVAGQPAGGGARPSPWKAAFNLPGSAALSASTRTGGCAKAALPEAEALPWLPPAATCSHDLVLLRPWGFPPAHDRPGQPHQSRQERLDGQGQGQQSLQGLHAHGGRHWQGVQEGKGRILGS